MISSLELARLCGVSQGTVDRALHDRPGVSPATKARILAVALEHGYQPNPMARELLSGESRLIGAMVPAVNSIFFMDLMQEVKQACDAEGMRLLLIPITQREEFLEMLADCAARRFRGVLAVPPEEGITIPRPLARALPIATFLSPCRSTHIPLFAPDEVETGRRAAAYLADQGHTRILHATYGRHTTAIRDRAHGYAEEMRHRGHTPAVVAHTPENIAAALDTYLPTAIFCHNDWLALSVIRQLEGRGLRVPADISVLGVDDSPTFTNLYPDITTMHYPAESIANSAVAWVLHNTPPAPIPPLDIVAHKTVAPIDAKR